MRELSVMLVPLYERGLRTHPPPPSSFTLPIFSRLNLQDYQQITSTFFRLELNPICLEKIPLETRFQRTPIGPEPDSEDTSHRRQLMFQISIKMQLSASVF